MRHFYTPHSVFLLYRDRFRGEVLHHSLTICHDLTAGVFRASPCVFHNNAPVPLRINLMRIRSNALFVTLVLDGVASEQLYANSAINH